MATKKHKKRRRDTRSEEQKAQSARDLAQQASAQSQTQKKAVLSRSKDKAPEKAKSTKAVAKSDPNKKPSLWRRFVNYCKEVKGEMQRVVWPTRPELVNASLIVVGALVFFGVGIAIIDNIIIIPLDAIATLGVSANG
ncbi:MAG: preprotein translocase subunit SecE [Coriobacteriales bacterium]